MFYINRYSIIFAYQSGGLDVKHFMSFVYVIFDFIFPLALSDYYQLIRISQFIQFLDVR